ncbi:MAG: peptidylprolyl isomerase [Betaproteobacteria bacterium]|nr:peptidylprolyl isomerase [Betaproteobacteria bacterium]
MAEPVVAQHKVIYLTYSILDGAGSVFEQYDLPVGYVHGANSGLFDKIEQALDGHRVGDKVEVVLSPSEGFGEHKAELTYTDDIENVPPEYRYVGAEVLFENDQGEQMTFRVSDIKDGRLTVDGNHPLAGRTATFVVKIVSIRDATPEEIAEGRPADAGGACSVH